ncbi:trehalose-phosphatase [Microbacterium sp. CJ88]|uniref:trehalose-phosphatase n=1 Tax=Microbacterium sp. CJ88 TaxID=3445672 RepID=UPI003F65DCE2
MTDASSTSPAVVDATLDALRRIAATEELLVALDFDGTLSLLVKDSMSARMLPEARAAVEALAALAHTVVALVSGRSMQDLLIISEHTDDSPIDLVGSHGVEFWIAGRGLLPVEESSSDVALRDRLYAEAQRLLADLPGVSVEPKTFGFGIHTRGAADDDAEIAWQRSDALVAQNAPHWRRRTGHSIVEYSFRQEGKDAAVRALRERTGATAVLFAGDDTTDEDALASLQEQDLGVRIGGGPTAATLRVSSPQEFAGVLSELAALRAAAQAEALAGRE